jgi:hypothetical protein
MLAVALALGACRDNGVTDPIDAAVGIYSLVELNGSALPIQVGQQADGQVEVISGYLTLRRDSSYVAVINTRVTAPAGPVRIVASVEIGTFSAEGNAVQFRPAGAGTYSGTRDGRTISYDAGATRATFRKP